MTDPVPRATGAKSALKVFGVIVVAGLILNIVIAVLKHLARLPIPSAVTVVVGWLILFAFIGVVVSGIVVLVQRSSPSPSSPLAQPVQPPGAAVFRRPNLDVGNRAP
jgi:hypothetical protein